MLFRKRKKKDYQQLTDEDILTLVVNRAFNTGETVVWNEGDPLPDPAGPIRSIEDFHGTDDG